MAVAPELLYDLKRLRAEPPRAPFYAVLGHPVSHSKSPAMQQAALDALGIDARYVALVVEHEELIEALELLPTLGALGCNVTVPHKRAVWAWAHDLSGLKFLDLSALGSSSLEAGAVNTIEWTDRVPTCHNTDGPGWEKALHENFNLALKDLDLFLLGAGGAAQAILLYALRHGARACFANRSPQGAEALVKAGEIEGFSGVQTVAWEPSAIADATMKSDLVVNATSIGLDSEKEFPFAQELFRKEKAYYDLVYAAAPTPFLRAAAAAGGRTADGLSMLLHQGFLAFKIWHPALSAEQAARALAAMRAALAS